MAIQRPKRRYNKGPTRRKAQTGLGAANQIGARTPITMNLGKFTSNDCTATFDQPVVIAEIPGWFDTSSPTIVVEGIEQIDATSAKVTFNAPATGAITVPFEDPGIRNNAGGYLVPGSVTVP
jgi:hypothetical protein